MPKWPSILGVWPRRQNLAVPGIHLIFMINGKKILRQFLGGFEGGLGGT
jgi:hypothetical protein